MNGEAALRAAEQQMLMARPWEAAAEHTIWEITGEYPGGRHTFHDCLAQVLPRYVTGGDRPLFLMLGPLARVNEPVDPAWISRARPLRLVHRDTGEPYEGHGG